MESQILKLGTGEKEIPRFYAECLLFFVKLGDPRIDRVTLPESSAPPSPRAPGHGVMDVSNSSLPLLGAFRSRQCPVAEADFAV